LHPSFVSEATLDEYVSRINRLRPDFVSAISLPLYELVQHARKRGHRLHSPRLIFTSGTTLYPTMRDSIQEVFGCPVRDSYGSRENGLVAGECEMGRLHVFDFHTALEIVDQVGEPAMVGQEGRILLTSLHNLAMPLIRYEIGDVGVLGTGECSCGSGLPFLSRIAGRILEYFPTRDGRMVGGGFFFQLFYGHSWIKEFYVLQTDIDEMIVHFVPNPNRPVSHEDMEQITARIQQAMGSSCAVEWQEEASIPRTRHGKRLFTRSLVWEERNAALVRDMSVT